MSCSVCNSTPCYCVPSCGTECPEIVDYSFENQNLAGVGVLDNVTGTVVGFKGVRSLNALLAVTDNPALNTIDLEFQTDDVQGTQVFANAAARALAVPDFAGQFGVQLDTDIPYIAIGTGAGQWFASWLFLDAETTTVTGATVVDLVSTSITVRASDFRVGIWLFDDAHLIVSDCLFNINNGTQANITNGSELEIQAGGTLDMLGTTTFGATVTVDLITGSRLKVNGGANLTSSLVGTSSAGDISAYSVFDFLSTHNTQTGWGTPTGTLLRTTYVTYTSPVITNPPTQAEVQAISDALQGVSRRLAALITDLKLVHLPAT